MAKVRKGNRELTIDEHKVDSFISQGYDQINEDGNVIKKGNPVTLSDFKEECNSLRKEKKLLYHKLETTVAELEAVKNKNELLSAKITELETTVAELNDKIPATKKSSK